MGGGGGGGGGGGQIFGLSTTFRPLVVVVSGPGTVFLCAATAPVEDDDPQEQVVVVLAPGGVGWFRPFFYSPPTGPEATEDATRGLCRLDKGFRVPFLHRLKTFCRKIEGISVCNRLTLDGGGLGGAVTRRCNSVTRGRHMGAVVVTVSPSICGPFCVCVCVCVYTLNHRSVWWNKTKSFICCWHSAYQLTGSVQAGRFGFHLFPVDQPPKKRRSTR